MKYYIIGFIFSMSSLTFFYMLWSQGISTAYGLWDPTGKISLKKNYEGFGEGTIFFSDKVSTSSQPSLSGGEGTLIAEGLSPNASKKSLPQPFRVMCSEWSRETISLYTEYIDPKHNKPNTIIKNIFLFIYTLYQFYVLLSSLGHN